MNAATKTADAYSAADDDWTRYGKWEVRLDNEVFRIFPKNKDGQTFPVTVRRSFIYLRRENLLGEYDGITFKHYLHRRNLYWSDSRQKGSCARHHVSRSLARLLFKGDEEPAKMLMAEAEARL